MLHLLWQCFIGLCVGLIAKVLIPGGERGGIVMTMLLGIAGSLLATNVGHLLGLYGRGAKAGCFMSILGAILLLVVYRLFVT